MPLLTPQQGELIIALFTILFGIVIEKWYVSKSSIAVNVITWFVLLFTISISPLLFLCMVFWLAIGFILTFIRGWGGIKQLFGSKVFGSMALILGLYKYGYLPVSGIWVLILFGGMVATVFVCGHKFAEYDDRNEY